jgi:fatty-acyl-CoA synthase
MARLVGEVLAEAAARYPDKVAIVEGDRRLTYADLDRAANRFANALLAAGVAKGEVVAILSGNRVEYPVFLFGAARSGCVGAHLSVRYTGDDLRYVIGRCDITSLFVHADLAPLVASVRDALPSVERVVVFGGPAGDGCATWDAFLGDAPDTPPAVALAETDPFCLTFTGGTTGFPKAVLVDHRARVTASQGAWAKFALTPDDVLAQVTPMFHVAGLFSWYLTGVVGGCGFVFMPGWDAAGFIDLVAEEKITAGFMVPTQVGAMLQDPAFDKGKLASLRYLNYGGAAMPVALLHRLHELFPDMVIIEHYGQSEVGAACFRPPEMALAKPTSVGIPFPGVELAILDVDDRPVPAGQSGEVAIRSPALMREYYRDPEQTAAVFTADGWLKTGDVGYRDDDGYLVLVDRSKDVIISGGENIYPTEIENALYKHDAVRECAVFGIPDDRWGEVPAAHVVLTDDVGPTEQELIDFVATRIPRHKRPRLVVFVEALPKTAVGKIQKNVLRAPYWEGRDRAI